MKILVTGSTGYIGGRLVPRLLEKKYFVRCLVRQPENLGGRSWNDGNRLLEIVEGDVLDAPTLSASLQGIDCAYYLVHSMAAGEEGFDERDRIAASNFASAAKKAGIGRIIYLGGLGNADDSELSPHLRSRHEVGNLLRRSGVPVTEFRAAIIVGSGSVSFEMIRYLTEHLPVIGYPKCIMSRCQPIAIRDVLSYLVESLEEPASTGKIIEIGGKNVLTYRDMMAVYARMRGLRRLFLEFPVHTPRLFSYWIHLVTPIPAALARPLIESLKNDVVCRSGLARRIFSIEPISYEEALRLALERIQEGEVKTIWSGAQSSTPYKSDPEPFVEVREGMIMEIRRRTIYAPPEKVFRIFSGLGGDRGWIYATWMWRLRGFIDSLIGGVGMRRGRRNPDFLQAGDPVDFWRVEEIKPNSLLRLRVEMKLPGDAWLQFEARPMKLDNTRFLQIAFFEPKGLFGLLYWYVLYPVHRIIFSGLCRGIKEQSEKS